MVRLAGAWWGVAAVLGALTAGAWAQPLEPSTARLDPLPMEPLPLGSIHPDGWLRRQLEIQARGLSGHLDEFWPDVADSAWIGGKAEGWERAPYWLDGLVPLAIHLDDPRLKAKAQRWIDYILEHPAPDGWLGPVRGNPDQRSALQQYDVWPRFILLKALTQWHEATGDPRILPAMTRLLRVVDHLLDEQPLNEWARVRWADLVLSIYWLYDRTGEPWLLELAAKVRHQGLDWPALARDFPYREPLSRERLVEFQRQAGGHWINDQFGATHGVNVAMGLKAPGVWSRQSHDPADRQAVFALLESLDTHHGQATGMFAADEHLAGRHPSHGTELCAVVETMYSLETLLTIIPDVRLADRLESIAYNALPATFSDDMWSHQYDQQANQVVCRVSDERIYVNNGPEANLFGVEPNFGCCLANMHQGWPKLVSHLWMRPRSGGLALMVYAPCRIHTTVENTPVAIHVETDYPFSGEVAITVDVADPVAFPLLLRIPGWGEGASVSVAGGNPVEAPAGALFRLDHSWSGRTVVRVKLPLALRAERRDNRSLVIRRGPLVMSLEVKGEWVPLRGTPPRADWQVYPTTPWNYALDVPVDAIEELSVEVQPPSDVPFSSIDPPVRIPLQGRRIPEWELDRNAAAKPPASPVASDAPLDPVRLIPYGCAKLRLTEIPVLADQP